MAQIYIFFCKIANNCEKSAIMKKNYPIFGRIVFLDILEILDALERFAILETLKIGNYI